MLAIPVYIFKDVALVAFIIALNINYKEKLSDIKSSRWPFIFATRLSVKQVFYSWNQCWVKFRCGRRLAFSKLRPRARLLIVSVKPNFC